MGKDLICSKCGYDNIEGKLKCRNCDRDLSDAKIIETGTREETLSSREESTIYVRKDNNENAVAKALKVISIISLILSIWYSLFLYNDTYELGLSLVVGLSGSVSSLILLGFSEIIRLLHEIRNK